MWGMVDAGIVAGVVTSIAGTCSGLVIYLAVTFAYRAEKRMIVQQVQKHLAFKDIAQDPGPQINAGLRLFILTPMMTVAGAITYRCLNRWDAVLGHKAKSDNGGRRPGIWMDKFETVRYASMLLALHRLNANITSQSTGNLWRKI